MKSIYDEMCFQNIAFRCVSNRKLYRFIVFSVFTLCLGSFLFPAIGMGETKFPAGEEKLWKERLVKFYSDFHLTHPNDLKGGPRLFKWVKPMRIIPLNLTPIRKSYLDMLIQSVSIGTDLDISFSNQGIINAAVVASDNFYNEISGQNRKFYKQFFENEDSYNQFLTSSKKSECLVRYAILNHYIQGFLIFVQKSANQEDFTRCINLNFAVGLGFKPNPESTIYSLLSKPELSEMGFLERKAIQFLYRKDVPAGITLNEFFELVGLNK